MVQALVHEAVSRMTLGWARREVSLLYRARYHDRPAQRRLGSGGIHGAESFLEPWLWLVGGLRLGARDRIAVRRANRLSYRGTL